MHLDSKHEIADVGTTPEEVVEGGELRTVPDHVGSVLVDVEDADSNGDLGKADSWNKSKTPSLAENLNTSDSGSLPSGLSSCVSRYEHSERSFLCDTLGANCPSCW